MSEIKLQKMGKSTCIECTHKSLLYTLKTNINRLFLQIFDCVLYKNEKFRESNFVEYLSALKWKCVNKTCNANIHVYIYMLTQQKLPKSLLRSISTNFEDKKFSSQSTVKCVKSSKRRN